MYSNYKRFDKHFDQRRAKQSLTKFMTGTVVKMVWKNSSIYLRSPSSANHSWSKSLHFDTYTTNPFRAMCFVNNFWAPENVGSVVNVSFKPVKTCQERISLIYFPLIVDGGWSNDRAVSSRGCFSSLTEQTKKGISVSQGQVCAFSDLSLEYTMLLTIKTQKWKIIDVQSWLLKK